MTARCPTGGHPLAPQPMTPAEVVELVERTRAAMPRARDEYTRYLRQPTSLARVGARLAFLAGCSMANAAHVLSGMVSSGGVTRQAVRSQWLKLYPELQPALHRRCAP